MRIRATFFSSLIIAFIGTLTVSCNNSGGTSERLHFEKKGREVPTFSADSAYQFIQKQVDFGPRNPGSEAHDVAQAYLTQKLKTLAGPRSVFVQNFTHIGYQSDTLHLANIIAAFNPQSSDRIMLCAHWDSRPRADQDTVNKDLPILGADDGGSGVAVLLELARMFKDHPPPIGVDLILFDGEDYGKSGDMDEYFLGSRYWANHPPVKNYKPRFGILLDMVGGEHAQFPKEQMSMRFAPALVNEIWSIADQKGYSQYFPDQQGAGISDDHVVIYDVLQLPTIDIVRHQKGNNNNVTFAPYWHTHRDDMDIISRKTLRAVGNVLSELIYNRI